MPFVKGNQCGVGYGRPPIISEEDLKVLGEELLSWMDEMDKSNTEVVHLSEFYSNLKGIPRSDWWLMVERPCFTEYYDKARDWMGQRVLKNERLNPAYGSRFLGMYLKDLRNHEKEIAKEKIDYEIEKRASLNIKDAPQDTNLALLLNEIKLRPQVDALIKENADLKAKLNASLPKTDPIDQRSE